MQPDELDGGFGLEVVAELLDEGEEDRLGQQQGAIARGEEHLGVAYEAAEPGYHIQVW